MEKIKGENLIFQELTPEEKAKRGILGRLYGPCADVINPTRNDRKYSEELWEKVFKDPIVTEMLAKGGIPGELDHPEDRTEIDSSKIAIIMPEAPKKNDKGQLVAYFDILDTPNGRIAYQLAKYGFQLGVSSRGNGDVYESYGEGDIVDPDTYEFKCFDLVLCPSVKAARLTLQESIGNKTFKQAIRETLRKATEQDRKIMKESLDTLKIDYKQERKATKVADNSKTIDNKKVVTEQLVDGKIVTAEDNGAAALVQELQKEIMKSKSLQEEVNSLQEKLSVCYAKEAKYEENLAKTKLEAKKETLQRVSTLKSEIKSLTESLATKDATIEKYKGRIKSLSESKHSEVQSSKVLNESLASKDSEIKHLKESLVKAKQASKKKEDTLTEQLAAEKKNALIKTSEYNQKIVKANKVVESYKKVAQTAMSKYIDVKATILGCSSEDIKARLTENYSFNEIDRVCEHLQQLTVTKSRLPIAFDKAKKVTVTESVEPIRPRGLIDDEVDESLLRLAGLNN